MAPRFVSRRNLIFMLDEALDAAALTRYPYFEQHNRKMFHMVVDAALKLAKDMLHPTLTELDRQSPELTDGRVKVHPSLRRCMQEFGHGGWIGAGFPVAMDGEQLPLCITNVSLFIFAAANYSASVYPQLSAGAARLITAFGGRDLIDTYVPPLLDGRWQGTMALTEPQAGSSLADIATLAAPAGDGTYRLRGQKVFISAGDHDAVDNVVHLLLAKIVGAPPSIKGISLFVVPRQRLDANGQLAANDVIVTQIYHKLGYRGAPIVELSLGEKDDCHGYLVGEPHRGLVYMFQMMNEARLGVGLGAAAIASAAYFEALAYAKERRQGRQLSQKDPSQPQIPIIEHADVRRMLLFQRAVVEGSLSLLLQCSRYYDLQQVCSGTEREKYTLLLELLIPVAKSYPSEMGILSVSQSLQCFGGYGYCQDFAVEQHYRDARIHPIHEGTTGIHGLDLLGRKVLMGEGRALDCFAAEVDNTLKSARAYRALQPLAAGLQKALERLQATTRHLVAELRPRGVDIFLADATLYLELFGLIAVAWQWLLQASAAQRALDRSPSKADSRFYNGKLLTCRYFFAYELPKIAALIQRLTDDDPLTNEMESGLLDT